MTVFILPLSGADSHSRWTPIRGSRQELNLHAALQLDFLSSLARNTQTGVVFATHSLGLARSSAEYVYVVDRQTTDSSAIRPYEGHEDLPSLAAQLGFDGKPELGFRKVLLVEGKTEVRVLLQLLRLYRKEHEIALVPLGGGELIHKDSDVELRELQRLGEVNYLIDSERADAAAAPSRRHNDFADLCKRLKIDGLMLKRRALENYFSAEAIGRALGSGHAALGDYGTFSSSTGWSKKQNWRIASEIEKPELDGTDLGEFLANL